jgi:hypothetical protein
MDRSVVCVFGTIDDITAGAAEFCDGMMLMEKRNLAVSVIAHGAVA